MARGQLRRGSRAGRELWRALVAARWSLVDHFDADGRRYYVAHRNDPGVADPRALTPRERHVVALAALGRADKLIAYELGLSRSAVAFYLGAARRKLGVGSRTELIEIARSTAHLGLPSGEGGPGEAPGHGHGGNGTHEDSNAPGSRKG
jgi:DNA-binding CsgD family transcriptional regulator